MSDCPNRVQYALSLLSSFEEIRGENILCDFSIRAGEEEFPVHRAVLAASSRYFRALLQIGMMETRQGFVDMNGMNVITAKIVVSYLYTGEAQLKNEVIGDTLEAAHLLQLDGLISICWGFLQKNMSAENCVLSVQLSRLYDRRDVENDAEKYLVENLGQVSLTKSFSTISKNDIMHYIENSKKSHEILWQVVVSWVSQLQENRDDVMVELMKVVKLKDFPFHFLLEKIATEDLVRNSASVKNHVLEEMFSQTEFDPNLSHENVFSVKEMVQESNITRKEDVMNILRDYISKNLEDLIEKEEFVHLNEDDLLMALQSARFECSSEESKWKAILKWTKHDCSREKSFTMLFKFVKLENFSNDFIRDEFSREPIVNSSSECLQLIADALSRKKKDAINGEAGEEATNPSIAILNLRWNGSITLFDVNTSSFRLLNRLDQQLIDWSNSAMVNCNNEIYMLFLEDLFQLDENNKLNKISSIPRKAGVYPKMVSLRGDIYILADESKMFCYHPMTNEWTTDLPSCGAGGGFCALSSESDLYVLGGRKDGEVTNEFELYNPDEQKWLNMPRMLEKRSCASAAFIRETIVVAGGYHADTALNSVECYTIFTQSWSKLTGMNSNSCHKNFTLLNICDKLYACGGDTTSKGTFKGKGTIEVYDEKHRRWITSAENKCLSSWTIACEYFSH